MTARIEQASVLALIDSEANSRVDQAAVLVLYAPGPFGRAVKFDYELEAGAADVTRSISFDYALEPDASVFMRSMEFGYVIEIFQQTVEFSYSLLNEFEKSLTFDYEIMPDPVVQPSRVTQAPILVVNIGKQASRLTQVPILVLAVPEQPSRITQAPIIVVDSPVPIPLPSTLIPEVPVTEVWQYKTVVNVAENGKEQRTRLRSQPRVSMSFDLLIEDDAERQAVYQMMFKFVNMKFNYPMYHYWAKLTSPAIAGATQLLFNPALTDMRPGEPLALFDPHLNQLTYHTITTLGPNGANLAEPLPFDVPAYFMVCPAPLFRTKPTIGFQMGSIAGGASLQVEGAIQRDVMRPGQATGLINTNLGGMLLLDQRPLANDNDVDEEFTQNTTWLDNQINSPQHRTNWYSPMSAGERKYLVRRPAGFAYWREVADYLKGQQNPFLLPTFRNDLPLAEIPMLGATSFNSTNLQFYDFWRAKGWQYIRLQSKAGVLYRRVAEVKINHVPITGAPGSINVAISGNIGNTVGSNEDMVISFVNTCRLDSDDIVIEHEDVDSILTIKFRMVNE